MQVGRDDLDTRHDVASVGSRCIDREWVSHTHRERLNGKLTRAALAHRTGHPRGQTGESPLLRQLHPQTNTWFLLSSSIFIYYLHLPSSSTIFTLSWLYLQHLELLLRDSQRHFDLPLDSFILRSTLIPCPSRQRAVFSFFFFPPIKSYLSFLYMYKGNITA